MLYGLIKVSCVPLLLLIMCILMCGDNHLCIYRGSTYYISFIYDYMCYTWVYHMKNMFYIFLIVVALDLIKIQYLLFIKCFYYGLWGELTFNDFTNLLASDGTIHQSTLMYRQSLRKWFCWKKTSSSYWY